MNAPTGSAERPYLGFGLGLRPDHYETILNTEPDIDWLEIISENYMVPGGKPLYYLERFRERYPLVMHGVSMSLGSSDLLDWEYLRQLKSLADRVEPLWLSDHLCWTGVNRTNMHDLLPLPYTEEALRHVVGRLTQVQDYLQRRVIIENVSSYVAFRRSVMSEWEFLRNVAEQADCGILLDVNNIYVSGFNHAFDPKEYVDNIPSERVFQFHLAGHTNHGNYIVDTHSAPVVDSVWELYAHALQRFGRVSTMIERDNEIPPLEELVAELEHARNIAEAVERGTAA